jgi:hypothetical protein
MGEKDVRGGARVRKGQEKGGRRMMLRRRARAEERAEEKKWDSNGMCGRQGRGRTSGCP